MALDVFAHTTQHSSLFLSAHLNDVVHRFGPIPSYRWAKGAIKLQSLRVVEVPWCANPPLTLVMDNLEATKSRYARPAPQNISKVVLVSPSNMLLEDVHATAGDVRRSILSSTLLGTSQVPSQSVYAVSLWKFNQQREPWLVSRRLLVAENWKIEITIVPQTGELCTM